MKYRFAVELFHPRDAQQEENYGKNCLLSEVPTQPFVHNQS
jgi:hypothetical protein